MSTMESFVLRYVIRKTRKELGLRQEDVADKTMSYGTISNIERGTIKVDNALVERYLKKLGLTKLRLKHLIKLEEEKIEILNYKLEAVESLLNNKRYKEAETLLKKVKMERFHPLAPYHAYLEGRICHGKGDYSRAEKHYKLAIRLHRQYNLPARGNIVATCFNELGICNYVQYQLDKAMHYTEKGLQAYNENEDGNDVYYPLKSNKVLYLLTLRQFDAAKQVLNELWESISQINNTHVVLNLYRYHALILQKIKRYDEAVNICKEGIKLARRNRVTRRYLDLLNVLGSVYLLQKQYEKAILQFETVLMHDDSKTFAKCQIDALSRSATLYSELEEHEKAEEFINTALNLSREVSQKNRLPKVLYVAGCIFFNQGKYKNAILHLKESVELAEITQDKETQSKSLLLLSKIFDNMGLESDWIKTVRELHNLQYSFNREDWFYEVV